MIVGCSGIISDGSFFTLRKLYMEESDLSLGSYFSGFSCSKSSTIGSSGYLMFSMDLLDYVTFFFYRSLYS